MGRLPRLTADIIADDTKLDAFIAVVLDTPDAKRRSRRIRQLQNALRRLLTEEQWQAYLAIEQTVNERVVVQSRVIARAAFEVARKERR